ncbi:MAG: VTT domain-containing protein, partial [Sphingomonadales bacterium]
MPQAADAGPARWRWWLLAAALLVLLLLPWLLVGDALAALIADSADALRARPWAGIGLVVLLLALDPVLPVPSSLVGVAGGSALGLEVAAMAIWVGQMAGCALGYWLGRRPGRQLAARLTGDRTLAGLAAWRGPVAPLLLVLSRPVPVLAEAVVIMAGAGRMAMGPFVASTALANLALALVYAG